MGFLNTSEIHCSTRLQHITPTWYRNLRYSFPDPLGVPPYCENSFSIWKAMMGPPKADWKRVLKWAVVK